MSRSIADHYDTHLAEHYSWLFGGLPERVEENLRDFERRGLRPAGSKKALDIGAGSGFQSIPLARLGYDVTAVDLSRKLLDELAANAKDLRITCVTDDVLHYLATAPRDLELCVCMGDTLTHLASFGDVQRLLRDVHRALMPGGRFVIGFRDLTSELVGEQRFIPVRGDETTVFTCFLEYDGDHARVYDVIHRLGPDGWSMRVSSYKKLRIAPDWLRKRAADSGFVVDALEEERGWATLSLRKPA